MHSIIFQTFFVQAFIIVVDSCKFIRRLTNFYDFSFKWTATAAIGIHPTTPWLSQLVNFKNTILTWQRIICNKFFFKTWKKCCAIKAGSTAMTQRPRDSSQWQHAGSPRPKKAKKSKSTHKLLMISFFWQHLHDLHALGSHWTDSQQGILC